MRNWCSAAAVVAFACIAPRARAGTFDPNGDFSFDPGAVYTQSFEDVAPQDGVTSIHAGDAVVGASYVNINTMNGPAEFAVTLPAGDTSYVARMYASHEPRRRDHRRQLWRR